MEQNPSIENLAFVEELWRRYREDRATVPEEWRRYFEQLERDGVRDDNEGPTFAIGRQQLVDDLRPGGESCKICGRTFAASALQHRVGQLIRNYRVRGHRVAHVNPLQDEPGEIAELQYEYYGFAETDLALPFNAGSLAKGGTLPLKRLTILIVGKGPHPTYPTRDITWKTAPSNSPRNARLMPLFYRSATPISK